MKNLCTLVGMAGLLLASGCSNNDEYVAKLKAATDAADISLRDAVALAEAEAASGAAINAALLVDGDAVFSVRAEASQEAFRYHIDLQGTVLSANSVTPKGGPCGDSISLVQAIDVAEAEAGGEAVAIVPDDDVACAFEIQVLQPNNLWEVKVSKAGEVLESEDSDENGTPDND
jgi:uncharacterized membrane protein YkoI